jgi:hypothetical protein
MSISAPIRACHANDHAYFIPTSIEGVAAGIITNLNSEVPLAPIFFTARIYNGEIFGIPL